MARIEWIEQRLVNWANWKLGESGSYAGVQLGQVPLPRDPYADAPIPISNLDAAETDAGVQRLPVELKRTVEEVYAGRGGERDKMARLGIGRSTLYERIDAAHRLLASHFTSRAELARTERARVEALQAGMRPA